VILQIAAESGDLYLKPALMHQHHAKMRAHLPSPGKQPDQLIGPSGSGHIEILWNIPQQQIAHASAREICRITSFAQAPHDRNRQLFRAAKGIMSHASMLI